MRGDRTLHRLLQPLTAALDDRAVTDVVVNEPRRVVVKRAGKWSWLDASEFTFEHLDAASILIAQRSGREFDEEHPYANSTLPGGERFQACRPPATKPGRIVWAIRKPPATARSIDDPDFDGLFDGTNIAPPRRQRAQGALIELHQKRMWKAFFAQARQAGMTIGVCGETGSGKTDLLRRLIQISRPETRMVTIETDDEFGELGPPNKASIFYDEKRIGADECVKVALRLAPDEIWHQEVRGPEAYSFLRALASGHAGGGTSWHAEEGREFQALELMLKEHPGGRALPDDRLRQFVREYIDIVVHCERNGGKFRVSRVWFKPAPDPDPGAAEPLESAA